MKRKNNNDIDWVCDDCGIEANKLTCLKKYGKKPIKAKFDISTYHMGTCDCCGEKKEVSEPRDYFYPDFQLLFNKYETNEKPKQRAINQRKLSPKGKNGKTSG
jgi:hypothetical protein